MGQVVIAWMLEPNAIGNGLQSIVVVGSVVDTRDPRRIGDAGVREGVSRE